MVNTTNDVVGKIYEWNSEIGYYFSLNSTNEQLAEENAMLRQKLSIMYDTTSCTYNISQGDTLYKYIPAQVVNNSINQANNYIIINKGALDGIERDMSVISSEGIVGVVTDVTLSGAGACRSNLSESEKQGLLQKQEHQDIRKSFGAS